MKLACGEIERREHPPRDEFEREFLLPERPVIITGAMEDWPALTRWTLDYFKTVHGSTMVPVVVGGTANGGEQIEPMRLRDYMDILGREDCYSVNRPYYCVPHRILKEALELEQDIRVPPYCTEPVVPRKLWFGPAGMVVPVHHDFPYNLHAAVMGRKKVILFPARQSHFMYSQPWFSKNCHVSQVYDVESAEMEHFPLLRQTTPLEGIVGPGEIVFIPPDWWHHVRYLETSIAVSFFWAPLKLAARKAPVYYVQRLAGAAYRRVFAQRRHWYLSAGD